MSTAAAAGFDAAAPVVDGKRAAGDVDSVAGDWDFIAGGHTGHVGEGKRAAAGTAPAAAGSEIAAGSTGGTDVAAGTDADTGNTAAGTDVDIDIMATVGSAACRGSELAAPPMPVIDCCRLVSTTLTAAVAMAAASSCVMEPVKPCRDRLGSDTTASVCATKASKRGPTTATSAAVVSDRGRWEWPLLRAAAVGTTVTAPAAAWGVLACCGDGSWESGTGDAAAAGVTLTGGDKYTAMVDCRGAGVVAGVGAGVARGFWGTVVEDAGS